VCEILVEQQPTQGVLVCDDAGVVIPRLDEGENVIEFIVWNEA